MDPLGGGSEGGRGQGGFTDRSAGNYVRRGQGALRLEVWREGPHEGFAWAATSAILPCDPRSRVTAGMWIYVSSQRQPVRSEETYIQLRVEFCADHEGQEPPSGRALFSQPIQLSQAKYFDQWRELEIGGLAPSGARCMKITILMLAPRPGEEKETVWIDDAYVKVEPPESSLAVSKPRR
jgi:hypothetical protein